MKVDGQHYRTIWIDDNNGDVQIIDQRKLPHFFEIESVNTMQEMAVAIKDMHVRGAGLVGASAGCGMYLAAREAPEGATLDEFAAHMNAAAETLQATRPTAANLEWAVKRLLACLEKATTVAEKQAAAREEAQAIMDDDAQWCELIGKHGVSLIEEIAAKKATGERVNLLTHCNAGWLAFVDYGSATAPIYEVRCHRHFLRVVFCSVLFHIY